MAAFSTKDFSAGKTAKVRNAVARKLGHPETPATNQEVDDVLTQFLRELVQVDDLAVWQATKPAADPL